MLLVQVSAILKCTIDVDNPKVYPIVKIVSSRIKMKNKYFLDDLYVPRP